MNDNETVQYSHIKHFIKKEDLPESHHLVKTLAKGEAFEFEHIEYFLSTFSNLPGFERKKSDLANQRGENENKIWINYRVTLSEITAAYILQKSLGLPIKGFNQIRPGYPGDCDILALLNGTDTYFEVKTRSGEQSRYVKESIEIECGSYEYKSYLPDSRENVEKWIILHNRVEADEKKGADYLMCLVNITHSGSFDDLARSVFDDLCKEGEKPYLYCSEEEKLGNQLSGIILFIPCGHFMVVNNKNKISGNFIT